MSRMMTSEGGQLLAVTGASGFIGRNLVPRLRADGWRVRVLVRSRPPDFGAGVETVLGSLEDFAALRRLVAGADAVIHCAGAVRGADYASFARVNVTGFGNLLWVMRSCRRPPRLLHLSSLAARRPGISWYAASKAAGEKLLTEMEAGLDWTIIRPPAVYGPGDREMLPLFRLLARGVALVPGDGRNRFSLLHVEDLVAALCALLQFAVAGSMFELSDGRPEGYDWSEIIDLAARLRGRRVCRVRIPPVLLRGVAAVNLGCARLFGYRPMLTPGKVREVVGSDWVCGHEALTRAVGWVPRIDLESGLRPLCRWR